MSNYPDNINFALLDRSQASRTWTPQEVIALNALGKAIEQLEIAAHADTDESLAIQDVMTEVRAIVRNIED